MDAGTIQFTGQKLSKLQIAERTRKAILFM